VPTSLAREMDEHPQKLGRYELREVLGRGAMGVVYKAYDSFLDRIVAVKTYRQDSPMGEQVRRRFEREVRTASKLAHPNVVMVYDGGLEGDTPFLAMEFVEGPTLDSELRRRGRLPIAEALPIVLGVAEGLAYAHRLGVVHRDIKPANILLTPAGVPKVSDFGVAKLMSTETAASTMAVGTPSYMSPEQIEGKSLDARADVFGLAVLAYELLAGTRPFVADNLTAVLFQIMHADAAPPSTIHPELPAAVDAVFARALSKDVAGRTADALTFATDLRHAFGQSSVHAVPARTANEDVETQRIAPRSTATAKPVEAARQTKPSRRGWLIASVVVVLALVGGLAAYWISKTRVPEAPPPLVPAPTATPMPTAPPTPTATIAPTPPPPATEIPIVAPAVRPTAAPKPSPTATRPPPTITPTERSRAEPTATRAAAPRPTRAPTAAPPEAPAEAATPAVVAPPASASRLAVEIISEPAGAEVLMNGVSKGLTPARVTDIQPGSYEIEIRKDGYASYHKSAQFSANSEYVIRVTLGTGAAKGFIAIGSQPPGAQIRINGEDSGRTPATVGLTAGRYTVSVEQEGYPAQERTIDLKDGETHQLNFRFGTSQ